MLGYIAILNKDRNSAFGIHFPDLPGCAAAGETEEEAIANAAIALRMWSEDLTELPAPSSMEQLLRDSDARDDLSRGGIAVLVPLITASRKALFNVMLEPTVVAAADAASAIAGVSRSQFIEKALEDTLARDVGAVRIAPTRRRPARRGAGDSA